MSRPAYCEDCTYFWPDDPDRKDEGGRCAAQHNKRVKGTNSSCTLAEE